VNQSEHGLSAVIMKSMGEPWSITGPSPYAETTDPLPAYCGLYHSTTGWWGVVVHCPRGTHPQTAIQHYESTSTQVQWITPNSNIGLYRLPNNQLVVSARIPVSAVEEMKNSIAKESTPEFADTRFERRRIPAGVRYLPGKQLQLWFAL
jgi:hypothetical protein